jgi:hypothetical protein
MKNLFGYFVVMGLTLAFAASASAHEAHEHGLAHMNLVVEGQKLEIELLTPLANVISFEHAPETDAQKKEVRDMAAVMRKADALFIPSAAAQCQIQDVSLESGVIDDALLSPAGAGHVEKAHEHERGNGHDQDGHGHGDLEVEVSFTCRQPAKLNSITVELFRAFPDLHEVEVRMVTPKGQGAAELTAKSNIIRW